jgi:hypothetical protein
MPWPSLSLQEDTTMPPVQVESIEDFEVIERVAQGVASYDFDKIEEAIEWANRDNTRPSAVGRLWDAIMDRVEGIKNS